MWSRFPHQREVRSFLKRSHNRLYTPPNQLQCLDPMPILSEQPNRMGTIKGVQTRKREIRIYVHQRMRPTLITRKEGLTEIHQILSRPRSGPIYPLLVYSPNTGKGNPWKKLPLTGGPERGVIRRSCITLLGLRLWVMITGWTVRHPCQIPVAGLISTIKTSQPPNKVDLGVSTYYQFTTLQVDWSRWLEGKLG